MRYAQLIDRNQGSIQRNALIEDFAVRGRVLYQFLLAGPHHSDRDAIALKDRNYRTVYKQKIVRPK